MNERRHISTWPSWLFSVVVFLAILWLTLAPHPVPEDNMPYFPGIDKVVHACMFGGMAFALMFDVCLWRKRRKQGAPWLFGAKVKLMVGLAVSVFGGVIELLQWAMGMGRSADMFDLMADIAGVVLALVVSPYILRCMFSGRKQR